MTFFYLFLLYVFEVIYSRYRYALNIDYSPKNLTSGFSLQCVWIPLAFTPPPPRSNDSAVFIGFNRQWWKHDAQLNTLISSSSSLFWTSMTLVLPLSGTTCGRTSQTSRRWRVNSREHLYPYCFWGENVFFSSLCRARQQGFWRVCDVNMTHQGKTK